MWPLLSETLITLEGPPLPGSAVPRDSKQPTPASEPVTCKPTKSALAGCQPPGRSTALCPNHPGPGPKQPRWAGWAWALSGSDSHGRDGLPWAGDPPCSHHVSPGQRDEAPWASEGRSVQLSQAACQVLRRPQNIDLLSTELEPPMHPRGRLAATRWFPWCRRGSWGKADAQLFTFLGGKEIRWLVFSHLEFSSSQ